MYLVIETLINAKYVIEKKRGEMRWSLVDFIRRRKYQNIAGFLSSLLPKRTSMHSGGTIGP